MNKLTKEQAEWLLENIKPRLCGFAQVKSGVITYEALINFIENQCMEKPFPEFEVPHALLRVSYDEENYQRIIKLQLGLEKRPEIIKWLNAEEFKQFTEGCNKIVKWLEDNE